MTAVTSGKIDVSRTPPNAPPSLTKQAFAPDDRPMPTLEKPSIRPIDHNKASHVSRIDA
jgi:hypothetical protein